MMQQQDLPLAVSPCIVYVHFASVSDSKNSVVYVQLSLLYPVSDKLL